MRTPVEVVGVCCWQVRYCQLFYSRFQHEPVGFTPQPEAAPFSLRRAQPVFLAENFGEAGSSDRHTHMPDQDELSRLVAQALEAAAQRLPPDRRERALRQMRAELGHFLCHAPMGNDLVADIASRARIAALFGTTYNPP
ncbi:hypothetical protein [Roseomonas xinghualingensis]|uniref:hypothetical protein n=1 Tax=Roseomonas xinghualingensis TaxID=2986475 RepID=UPI0021F1C302|nr:hypothetical protein [Roseomonas sp. SXEYE001]MCV4207188.1 hypothetical protein [Roseomonas sp. SXEYE001]